MIQRCAALATLVFLLLLAVPAFGAERGASREARAATTIGDPVNINTADVATLMTLSGVGRRVAESIVEYRKTHGPFAKPDDVRKVKGVGPGLFERNRDRIVVK